MLAQQDSYRNRSSLVTHNFWLYYIELLLASVQICLRSAAWQAHISRCGTRAGEPRQRVVKTLKNTCESSTHSTNDRTCQLQNLAESAPAIVLHSVHKGRRLRLRPSGHASRSHLMRSWLMPRTIPPAETSVFGRLYIWVRSFSILLQGQDADKPTTTAHKSEALHYRIVEGPSLVFAQAPRASRCTPRYGGLGATARRRSACLKLDKESSRLATNGTHSLHDRTRDFPAGRYHNQARIPPYLCHCHMTYISKAHPVSRFSAWSMQCLAVLALPSFTHLQ